MADISLDRIEAAARRALIRHGAADWIAGHVADAIRVAEAQGNRICGLYYLESYCRQLRTGRVRGDVDPVVSRPRPGIIRVDARFGFAQPAFARGLPDALSAAAACGVAALAVGHAHTCTSLGYFTAQIARGGMIGIGLTNASAIVAAPGGRRPVIGTNPIAFAVPDGAGGIAMQFDQSTTAVALGKITMAKAAGAAIPEGWALDAAGAPTTDPGAALAGSLVSAGGHKGWGFGLMAEILAAGMAGGVLSREVRALKAPEGPPHDLGQFYLLIDPGTAEDFAGQVARLAAEVAEDTGTRMPGQAARHGDPVTLDDALWAQVLELAGG